MMLMIILIIVTIVVVISMKPRIFFQKKDPLPQGTLNITTVEPLNKGHVGDNINSAILSFVETLFPFGGSRCIRVIGKTLFGALTCVLCKEVYYLGVLL